MGIHYTCRLIPAALVILAVVALGTDPTDSTKYTRPVKRTTVPPTSRPDLTLHYPVKCPRMVSGMICKGAECYVVAGVGDCVNLSIVTGVDIWGTIPKQDPLCDLDTKLCVYVEDGGRMKIMGTVDKIPFTVYELDSAQRVGITVSFVSKIPTVPDPDDKGTDASAASEKPTRRPIIIPDFPSDCSRMITGMNCSGATCWVLGEIGDCVNLTVVSSRVWDTIPTYDPECNPALKLCVQVEGGIRMHVLGTIDIIPLNITELDTEGRDGLTIHFLNTTPVWPDEDAHQTDWPSDMTTHKFVQRYPVDCRHMITSMNCTGTDCWVMAKVGDCVNLTVVTESPIMLTDPVYDPLCDRDVRLCVDLKAGNRMFIKGTVDELPSRVSAMDSDELALVTVHFYYGFPVLPDHSEDTTAFSIESEETALPRVTTRRPIVIPNFPLNCTRLITGMNCSGANCWVVGEIGDCVNLTVVSGQIWSTVPAFDPYCNPDLTLCVSVESGIRMHVIGTISAIPSTVTQFDSDNQVGLRIHFLNETPIWPDEDIHQTDILFDTTDITDRMLHYPEKCYHMITSMSCNESLCWTYAKLGDCVDIAKAFDSVDTTTTDDPLCDRDVSICLRFIDGRMNITGTLMTLPLTVSRPDVDFEWKFLPWSFKTEQYETTMTTSSSPLEVICASLLFILAFIPLLF